MVCSIVHCCLIRSVFCGLPCVLLSVLDICVLLYMLIVVLYLLLDTLNICVLLCVLIVVQYVLLSILNMLCVVLCDHCCMCCSMCWIFVCCSMYSLLYVLLDMLDIFCVALFQCAAPLAYAPTINVALKPGKLGAVMLLDLANIQLSLLHTSRSVHPKNKDHNM